MQALLSANAVDCVYSHPHCETALKPLTSSTCWQDAYNAVQANPVAASALGNLLRLVNALVNTGNIATLCALPYAADFIVEQQDGR